jgi:hypothetical protein
VNITVQLMFEREREVHDGGLGGILDVGDADRAVLGRAARYG